MITLRTVAEVRAAAARERRVGASIGLVPTMGAFHLPPRRGPRRRTGHRGRG